MFTLQSNQYILPAAIWSIQLSPPVSIVTSATCSPMVTVLLLSHSSLRPRRFEFHAEWLRDEPCDATTTGQKTVPVSTLSWMAARGRAGNMRFGHGSSPLHP